MFQINHKKYKNNDIIQDTPLNYRISNYSLIGCGLLQGFYRLFIDTCVMFVIIEYFRKELPDLNKLAKSVISPSPSDYNLNR
ncbi:MAG: hypothetical protein WAM14_14585 [Candidatus Nitrosopolaris sp.]